MAIVGKLAGSGQAGSGEICQFYRSFCTTFSAKKIKGASLRRGRVFLTDNGGDVRKPPHSRILFENVSSSLEQK